jgi:DNA-binding response OmpR family regulator
MASNARNDCEETSARILMIDDDVKYCRLMRDYLAPLGFTVLSAHTGEMGLDEARKAEYQAVILDIMLPGIDGLEVLRRLRTKSNVPVLMLTARGEEADRIVGLELGADDYLPKTASPRELLARLKALLRRYRQPKENLALRIGDLQIDPSTRQGTLKGKTLPLTSFEFDLLVSLARSVGSIRTRESLLQEAAVGSMGATDRAIDVHISSLRKKLGDDVRDPEYIVTIRNIGYMLRRQS